MHIVSKSLKSFCITWKYFRQESVGREILDSNTLMKWICLSRELMEGREGKYVQMLNSHSKVSEIINF